MTQRDQSDSMDPAELAAFEITLRAFDSMGREVVYAHAFEIAKAWQPGQHGWMMTTGLTSPDHTGARAAVEIKRVQ